MSNEYQAELDRISGNVADTYTVLQGYGAQMPAQASSDNLAATAASIKVVKSITYDTSSNSWTVVYTDGSSETVEGPEIPNVSGYMPKSGGTFTGAVYAMSGAGTAAQVRNTALASTETTPTVNGQICWTYE